MTPRSSPDRDDDDDDAPGSQRLDKWLWFARVTKTRTMAAAVVSEGKVRINGAKVLKPAHMVKVGDTLAVVLRGHMRMLRVTSFGERRGSATVAAQMFEDLAPRPPASSPRSQGGDDGATVEGRDGARVQGAGRPTKRDRRAIVRFKERSRD